MRAGFAILLMTFVAALPRAQKAAPIGLDHIPVAVRDLDAAADQFRALGFALKPGQPHANGIRNQHAKFPDGTEIELITAPDARDALTTTYRTHLEKGDGPAFLTFFVDPAGASALEAPAYIFFGGLNHSPTDRPEHFAHRNGANALIAVWLAADELAPERQLLQRLGARFSTRTVRVPKPEQAAVATLPDGDEVFLLPGSRQLVPGRRIIGATVKTTRTDTVFIPPDQAPGLWLELRGR